MVKLVLNANVGCEDASGDEGVVEHDNSEMYFLELACDHSNEAVGDGARKNKNGAKDTVTLAVLRLMLWIRLRGNECVDADEAADHAKYVELLDDSTHNEVAQYSCPEQRCVEADLGKADGHVLQAQNLACICD